MANAQYWREQANMLRRLTRTSDRGQRRVSAERLPLRLRLRCDPTSARRLPRTNEAIVVLPARLAG
jgi:hypothetical protein